MLSIAVSFIHFYSRIKLYLLYSDCHFTDLYLLDKFKCVTGSLGWLPHYLLSWQRDGVLGATSLRTYTPTNSTKIRYQGYRD
jgi:hypothetical protein